MFWCKFDIGCDILLNQHFSPQVDNIRSRRTTWIKIGELLTILTFRYFCRSVKLLMSLAMYENMEVVSWKTKFDILSVKRGVTKNYYMTPLRFFILFFNILQHLLKITQLEGKEHGLPGRWRGVTQKRWVGGRKSNSRAKALNTIIKYQRSK